MRFLLGMIAAYSVVRGAGSLWFGSERLTPGDDVEDPKPPVDGKDQANWHHQDLTGRACQRQGFTDSARRSVQWHADFIDSYMYNPIFWVQGGVTRVWRALMLQEHLVKLHFDDLMDATAIEHMWTRYLAGTTAGLYEAAARGDVAAGRHLVGLSLHAIQDFYAHSNWVDEPARRTQSYLERKRERGWGRDADELYTGSYDKPDTQGVRSHGHYRFFSGIYKLEPLKSVLAVVCNKYSPWSSSDTCVAFREATSSVGPGALNFTLPDGVVTVTEGGIALDNTWIAPTSGRNRATKDSASGKALFAAAKELALRDSVSWLVELDRLMSADPVTAPFWVRVRTEEPVADRDRAFVYEDVGRLPTLFTAVGTYPPASSTLPPDDSWYLYLQIGTGANGTDAEVSVDVGGRSFPLDHGARADVITGFDDFKPGSTVAYAVGPLTGQPTSIVVRHQVRLLEDLGKALGNAAARVGQNIVNSMATFLPGGGDDFVGRGSFLWDSAALEDVKKARSRSWGLRVGTPGSEGRFDIAGNIVYNGDVDGTGQPGSLAARLSEFTVTLRTVTCLEESGADGVFTSADEIYLLTTFTNHTGLAVPPETGPVAAWESPMWEDVDSGDSTDGLRRSWTLRVPTLGGSATLGIQVWESDNDTADTRRRRLDGFANVLDTSTPTISGIINIFGSVVEDGWDLNSLRAFAFQRRRNGSRWCTLRTDLTPRLLGRQDQVTVALTVERSTSFDLFATARPATVRVGPTPTPGVLFDDTVTPHGPITSIELFAGDIVDGVRATHEDGTLDPVRGQRARATTVRFAPDDPLVGVSGMQGRYFGKSAVVQLTLHCRSGRSHTVGAGVADAGTVTRFDLRVPDPARQRVTGLFGSTETYTSGDTYLAGLGLVAAALP